MASTVYFDQECPICGRLLQVRLAYLGRKVACQHCHGEFEAADPAHSSIPIVDGGSSILRRADELLDSVEQVKSRPR